jgi:hypothetical protein
MIADIFLGISPADSVANAMAALIIPLLENEF